jgi:hypothetical protein
MKPKEAAVWMVEQLRDLTYLDQEHVVYHLSEYAPELTYYNNEGGLAIDKRVLDEFRKLTPTVVWSRSERHWREREEYDEPGKRMQD